MSMNSFHARNSRPAPVRQKAEKAAPVRTGVRADALLVAQGLAVSRSAARKLIEAGAVRWSDGLITKPAQELPADARLIIATPG